MNEIYASGGKIQDGFWDALEIPDNIRSAYGSTLKDYAHNLNETAEAGETAEASIQGLNNRLLEQGENIIEDTSLGEKFVDGLKSGGISLLKSIGTAGIDFAITATLQAGLKLLNNWINREQIAIDNGKKAQTEIGNTFDEFSKGKSTMTSLGKEFADSQDDIKTTGDAIDSVAEKYVQLSKGVNNKTNENVNLSDADYQSYLDLSNQLADLYPTLVSGYDIQGNAILNLSSNAKEAANSLKDLYDMQMLSSNATIGENLQQSYDGIMTQVKQYEKAIKSSKKTADEAGESIDNLNNNTTDYYKELTENGKIVVDSANFGSLTDYNDFQSSITNAIRKSGIEPMLGLTEEYWNDELDTLATRQEIILDTPIEQLSTQQSELLQSNLAKMKSDSLNSLQVTKNEAEKETSATELLIQDQWKSLSDSLGQYLQTSDTFTHLNEDVQNALLGNLKNVSLDPLKDENQYNGDVLDFLYGEFLEPLSKLSDKSQQALSDALNADEAEMTAKEYSDKVNSALKTAFPRDKELQKKWKDNFGLSDIIDENDNEIKTLSSQYKDSVDKINSMTNGDREIGYDIVINSDEVPKTFAELEQKIAETKGQLNQKDLSLDAMKQVVTDTTTAYSSLSTAMSESISGTGMTADSITAVKTALSSLVSENDAFKDASLDGIFRDTAEGVTMNADAVKTLIKKQRDMKVEDFAKAIRLQNEELAKQNEILKNPESDEAKNAALEKRKQILSDIAGIEQAQSQYNAQYQQMKDMFSDYNQWVLNSSKKTAGTPYNNIVSGLEQAYKDFKDGLTGTDSFKSFAAMISPTGATDPADFAENYAKANRYLQEGDEGVKNFLNDLKSHDLAEFNQQTGEWTIKAHNAAEAAEALATGTDVASAAFGKMQDYGLHDNTVDDVQDGVLKLGDAYTKLADSKAKLKEMEENPSEYSDVRIQAQRDEVQAYSQDIEDLSDNMQYYIEHQADEYNKQQQTAKEAIKLMDDYKKEVLASPDKFGGADNAMGVANYLEQQMQGYADTYGFNLNNMRQEAEKATIATKQQVQTYKDVYSQLQEEQEKINDWGLSEYGNAYDASGNSFVQKQFGNIDMDKRQVITWSNELKQTYAKELSSWDYEPEVGGVDTVFGGSDRFGEGTKGLEEGVEVAFTPIMNTPDGKTQFLGRDTVYDYINQLIGDSTDNGVFSEEKMLSLDKQGRQIGDKFVQGIIAGADTSLNYDNDGNKAELYGRMMHFSGEYGALGLAYSELGENAETVVSTMGKLSDAMESNNQSVQDSFDTLQKYSAEEVEGIDLFDGAYDSDELKPAEQALDTICQSLGLSKDEASQLGQVLEAMGVIKPEVDDSDIEKAGETADTTSEKVQSLKDLQSSGDISSDIELDFDTADMSADELKSKIDELNGLKAEIDAEVNPEASAELDDLISKTETDYKIKVALDTDGQTPSELLDMAQNDEATFKAKFELDDSGYQEALSYLQDKDVEVKVNATLAQGADISSLLNMTDEDLSTTLNIDTSQVDAARAELQSIQNGEITVPLTVKLEDSQFEAITNKNKDVTVTATVNGLPQITALDAALNKLHNKSVDVTANVNGTPETNALYSAIQRVNSKSVDVTANVSGTDAVNALVSAIAGVHSKTVTITSNHVTNNITNNIKGKGAQATGTMTSISRTRAYAFGSLDNFDFSPAYANGKISVDHDQVALMNELGMESRVRDGVWSLIPGGAHFENVKKDDIIFSAKQTQDLLKYGATSGHARAYAQGSLSDISLSNAFGLGSFKFSQDQPYTHKTSVSSSGGSSSQQSYNANSGAVARNTDETEKNTKAKSDSTETFNWVETKLKKFSEAVEHISNQITDYISSAFKTVLLKRQVKAVEKQLKANEQGYTAYMNKANSIDISDDYKNKVINGTFSIEEIDTSSDSGKQLAKDIKSFQTYYNSAQDCKDTVQELNNKLLELYETIVNMPTEKAEKKIDRLKTKLESLNAVSDTVSLGGSAIKAMQNQIKVDIPGLGNAQKKLDKAETARNATKKTRAKASKTLKSATVDAESTGNTLIKTSEKQTKSIGKKLKNAAKSSANKATYNAIAQAVREGKAVNTKGLKGSALKYAKSYNSSLKQGNTIASKVKAGKTVKTSGMSNILKSTAQAYNTDAKEKASAQKVYDNAKKADEKALNDLTKAQKNKDKLYSGSTKEQQILATTKGKKSYVYQNMLLTQETKNLKEQNKHRQKALKETRDSYMKAKSKYDTADADKTKSQNKILNNKSAMSKLNKTQQKALKAGKTVSTKGITDPKVLKWIQDYNEKVKKSADLSKKLRIEQEALDKATSEAAQSQAEYAQSIVENAKKKLENIANYYDSFTSQWENRNSMYEAYMDRMQTQGYNLSTKFYEAEIGQQQKIVDNLSQKYIAMKRNFAQAVQDGTIVEGTEEYYEMQNEIDQVALSLKEAQNKVVEFQASIRDLKWEQFDQLQDAIGRITSESDFLIDLMSHKDMYDKDGNMTEQGLATMGLHGVNYNTYMAQADKYKEEMLKISEELANDPNNQKLIDRKNELIDAQQQAILSAEDEKDSIKDLIQDGIDKQLDALDDLIDKYLDCLDSEKSLYEYRKKIGEQSEKIASLQKQLSSLQGDNSEENKAKLQKLKEDLKSAQDDMEETQYDKYISDQKKLLDELKQDYKKALDDRMDNVDVLISDAIASINSNSSNISQTLQTESKNVGYTLSGEMQTIWTSQSGIISQYGDDFSSKLTGVNSAIENVYNRQKDMIDAINAMAEKWIAKVDQMLQQPTKTEGVLEEVEQKPDKDNVAEGNPTPDPPKVSDKDSIKDAVLVDPDEPKKKPNKTNETKTGNGKAEVGDKVTFSSGRYYEASDGSGASGNMYLGKKVKITRINKGSKYPYAIDATDGTELGWVKLNQLKGYASGIMRVPNDQLAWTQEQGEEAIVRNDGSILTPLSRDVSVLNADMTKNLWDFMGNPGSFLSDYSDGEKFGVKNVDNSSSVDVGGVTIQCNMPNVQNANDLLHELTTNKDIEKAICAMTIGRAMSGSSLAKYKYKK